LNKALDTQSFFGSACTTSRPSGVTCIRDAVAALFLADRENSYMNSHVRTVDGGWTAGYTRDF
jgi:hypothetical protein